MTRAALAALAVAATLALSACGGQRHYPAQVEHNFLVNCDSEAPSNTCQCMLHDIEKHVSLSDFDAADAAVDAGQGGPRWASSAVRACTG